MAGSVIHCGVRLAQGLDLRMRRLNLDCSIAESLRYIAHLISVSSFSFFLILSIFQPSIFDSTQMAWYLLFEFLSLVQLAVSAPFGYTQATGRLIGNSFGVPGQNLTYDYIACASIPRAAIPRLD